MQRGTHEAHACYRKKRFGTQLDAERALKKTQSRSGFSIGSHETLNVYPCYACGGYHLGRHRVDVSEVQEAGDQGESLLQSALPT